MSANPPSPSTDRARVEAVRATPNQCDGCRRGLPLVDGIHRGEGLDMIGCTADRYQTDRIAAVRATLERQAAAMDDYGFPNTDAIAAALREAATWAPPVSESGTREALIAMQAAAEEVFARYIGGSPVEGKLGDAIDLLATASTQARKSLRGAPPADEGLRAALAGMLESFDLLDKMAVEHFHNETMQGVIRGAFLDEPAKARAALAAVSPLPQTGPRP